MSRVPSFKDAWDDVKNAGRKLSSAARATLGKPAPDHIAEIRSQLPRKYRNMRIDTNILNRLSTLVQEGTLAAEILITNTEDVSPPALEDLPRKLPEAARLLFGASQNLKEVRERGNRHRREIAEVKKQASEEQNRRVDREVEKLARQKAEELCTPLATEKARQMTEKARKDMRISAENKAMEKLEAWQNQEVDYIKREKERVARDKLEEWKVEEWDKVKEDKKMFIVKEKARLHEEAEAFWGEFEKEWTEHAKAEKKKEIAEGIKQYVAGDKRKRDATEAQLKTQVKSLTHHNDERSRRIKKLRKRLEACGCGADDSDYEDERSDAPQNPADAGRTGRVSGGNALSKAAPLPSGNGDGPSPPTGPRTFTDPRDKNRNGAASQMPPSNPYDQGRDTPARGGTAPDDPKVNHFDTAKKRPPGGWPEERSARQPLSQTPFEEKYGKPLQNTGGRAAAAAGPIKQTDPPPTFGGSSVQIPYPASGQFGAPSYPTPAGIAGTISTPVFGANSRTLNGGYQPTHTSDNSVGTGGNTSSPESGQSSQTLNGGYQPNNPVGTAGGRPAPKFGSTRILRFEYNPSNLPPARKDIASLFQKRAQ